MIKCSSTILPVSTAILASLLSACNHSSPIDKHKSLEKPDLSGKPNIIFLLTDDQRWDAIGCSGNEIISTPNMDKLASDGVYFKNTFVTTPICAASRASIVTGRYERTHGMTFGTEPLAEEYIQQSYFMAMKNAGYYTGFIGKFGMWFQHKLDTALFNHYDAFKANFYYRLRGENWGEHIHLTDYMGIKATDFIKNAPKDKPFCLSVSYNAPHAEDQSIDQYIWPPDLDSLYKDIIIPEPFMGDPKYFEEQPDYVKEGLNRVRWYWRYDTPEKYQRMVKGYYRMISGIDRTIGVIRETLEKEGIADNTIIIMLGDNGYFIGERGFAGKWLMYENSLRVPLIIYDPRAKIENHICEKTALNIDISPTILDYAGFDIPADIDGMSLKKIVDGEEMETRDEFLCEHLYNIKSIPQSEGIRTNKWKYFRYRDHRDHEELYDLENDPREEHNLVDSPDHADILAELRIKCDSKIDELNAKKLTR